MSATLDSNLFARYYGDCPVLVAGGRTFPVEHYFLEETYELTGCVGGLQIQHMYIFSCCEFSCLAARRHAQIALLLQMHMPAKY